MKRSSGTTGLRKTGSPFLDAFLSIRGAEGVICQNSLDEAGILHHRGPTVPILHRDSGLTCPECF